MVVIPGPNAPWFIATIAVLSHVAANWIDYIFNLKFKIAKQRMSFYPCFRNAQK